jgi:biopolymer transport protein ExbB
MDKLVYVLLGLTSVIGLGVIFWRGWMLRWNKVVPAALAAAVTECRTEQDLENLRQFCQAETAPLAKLILLADEHRDWPKADAEAAVETAARHEIVKLEQGLVVLEIIVGIAPLLGLVGTIFGMMTVFGDIGSTGLANMNDASKLAQGISLILRTTLIGLLISIPALVAWSYLSKKVEVLAVELETLCSEFIRRQYAGKK